jgi:hypothetical protein
MMFPRKPLINCLSSMGIMMLVPRPTSHVFVGVLISIVKATVRKM